MKLAQRCAAIRLLLTDVDGVLTDGGVILDNQGVESKCFNIRDGLAMRLWQHAGGQVGHRHRPQLAGREAAGRGAGSRSRAARA